MENENVVIENKVVEEKVETRTDKFLGFVRDHMKEIGLVTVGIGVGVIAKDKAQQLYLHPDRSNLRIFTGKKTDGTPYDGVKIQVSNFSRFGKEIPAGGIVLNLDDGIDFAKNLYDSCVSKKHEIWEATHGNINNATNS